MDAVVESRGSSTDYYRVEFHSSTAEVSCAAAAVEKFKSDSWIRVGNITQQVLPNFSQTLQKLVKLTPWTAAYCSYPVAH